MSKSKQDVSNAALFMDAYGVSEHGNFEGKNILHRVRDKDVLAEMHRLSADEVERKLEAARQKLFAARERRIKPARDEKILTGWNGLMLAAFAEAGRVLKREDYRRAAERNADFLLGNLRDGEGRLKRSHKDGQAPLNGYLEDYANLAEGLLALYETTFEEKYWVAARELADAILEHFSDPRGGFFDTSDDHEELVVRPRMCRTMRRRRGVRWRRWCCSSCAFKNLIFTVPLYLARFQDNVDIGIFLVYLYCLMNR